MCCGQCHRRGGRGPFPLWRLCRRVCRSLRTISWTTSRLIRSAGAAWVRVPPRGPGGLVRIRGGDGSDGIFDGSTSMVATDGPMLDTSSSYSVSAWVRLNASTSADQTVVGEGGVNHQAFYLQYSNSAKSWAFIPSTCVRRAHPRAGRWRLLRQGNEARGRSSSADRSRPGSRAARLVDARGDRPEPPRAPGPPTCSGRGLDLAGRRPKGASTLARIADAAGGQEAKGDQSVALGCPVPA
ncbi:LamG-like jellyroll fold domain-containing protein [Peterkaempfera sp. SMS 1(5)a]|uniref:LamG-like jellyroll fold domain-containing protein n=1 Tax=Peterkaempfera podocarpi TaxID=3232308 RepID=UPI00366CC2CD